MEIEPVLTALAAPIEKEAEIFLSFSGSDREIASEVKVALEAEQLSCWSFLSDQEAGFFAEGIARAIGKSRIIVLILTEAANASAAVQREIAMASANKLAIVPLRLDNRVKPTGALEFWLSGVQMPETIPELVRILRRVLEPGLKSGDAIRDDHITKLELRWWAYVAIALSLAGLLIVVSQVFCAPIRTETTAPTVDPPRGP